MQQENTSQDIFSNGMELDAMAKQYLRSMAGWAMIIVVVAVIGYVFNIVDLFRTKQVVSKIEGFEATLPEPAGTSTGQIITTFISIAIGLLINFFLYRFATQARAGVDRMDQSKLTGSFGNLKNYFQACSVILIIIFVYFLLTALVFGTAGKTI